MKVNSGDVYSIKIQKSIEITEEKFSMTIWVYLLAKTRAFIFEKSPYNYEKFLNISAWNNVIIKDMLYTCNDV